MIATAYAVKVAFEVAATYLSSGGVAETVRGVDASDERTNFNPFALLEEGVTERAGANG